MIFVFRMGVRFLQIQMVIDIVLYSSFISATVIYTNHENIPFISYKAFWVSLFDISAPNRL